MTTSGLQAHTPPWAAPWAASDSSTDSLATKPNSGGSPAMDSPAATATAARTGWRRPMPESWRRSRVPASWSMMPTIMNSGALNTAWARSMASPAIAASRVPRPLATMRKPSWETVP